MKLPTLALVFACIPSMWAFECTNANYYSNRSCRDVVENTTKEFEKAGEKGYVICVHSDDPSKAIKSYTEYFKPESSCYVIPDAVVQGDLKFDLYQHIPYSNRVSKGCQVTPVIPYSFSFDTIYVECSTQN
ncbi:hypothetical protein IWQ62_003961 [Dispira parvispora]|uniref:Uncharacterized protein n=1 Tax=Dispira parvispora TaxID=1520584 RepID=A0A9W8AMV9_9FUNG|nr:hypothetical protein IWQ62_003961 [Dispira parvispora]